MKKKLVIGIGILVIMGMAYSFLSKDNHRFASTSGASFFIWLQMRITEGSFPSIDPKDLSSLAVKVNSQLIKSPSTEPMATWVGHATMLVQYRGINFLTDPHLTQRPAPIDFIVPERLVPPAISFAKMPTIDFVVISHNHYDHLDHRTVDMFGSSVTWYVPLGLKDWFMERGIESNKVIELDWWQSHKFSEGVNVTLTPNVHWSKRTPWDTNQSRWGGWSVNIHGFNSWFAGDTGYDKRLFKEIGRRMGPYHLSFIPIGAYEPRYFMSKQHVDPRQAVLIHRDINSEKSVPIHWGTFQLTHEPFLEPPRLLKKEMERSGLALEQFQPIKIGQTIVLEAKVY